VGPANVIVLGGKGAVSDAVLTAIKAKVPAATVTRLGGADRYATAADLSMAVYPGGASTVFIASGLAYPDGLAGGAEAARLGAPLLLTDSQKLSPETLTELQRLAPTTVYLLGGTVSISKTGRGRGGSGPVGRRDAPGRRTATPRRSPSSLQAPASRSYVAAGPTSRTLSGWPRPANWAAIAAHHARRASSSVAAELNRLKPRQVSPGRRRRGQQRGRDAASLIPRPALSCGGAGAPCYRDGDDRSGRPGTTGEPRRRGEVPRALPAHGEQIRRAAPKRIWAGWGAAISRGCTATSSPTPVR
jgi:hypothetical protein